MTSLPVPKTAEQNSRLMSGSFQIRNEVSMTQAYKQAARAYIEEHAGIFTDVSDRIWASPELSLKEFTAAALYKKVLAENGFTVKEDLSGIRTAFSGSWGHGHPVIGILGEFDALSGLSQEKCSTFQQPLQEGASLAAAFAIKDYLEKSGREGTVLFFGCPGEEGGAGKAFMARDGLWRDLDAALTWHPSDVNEIVTGTNNSSIQVLYKFKGVAAHAAGDPWDGRSALDAVELMNTGVQYLREHMTSDCRVHYAITDAGGISPNVVQDHASVLYMVRANKVRDSVKLLARVDKIAEGASLMTETTFERLFIDGTAELVPSFTLEDLLYENFLEAGLPPFTEEEKAFADRLRATCPAHMTPGNCSTYSEEIAAFAAEKSDHGRKGLNDFLLPVFHTNAFFPGSTDVGDVSWQTPAAQVHVTAFVNGAPGHSWQNVSTGGSSIGHKALLHAGKILAMTAIDLYEDPSHLKKAREEFERRTRTGYVCPIEPEAFPIAL